MVERTDDQPGTGSAAYCSAVSLRQAAKALVLAQRSYANNATTSSCMVISPVNCNGWFVTTLTPRRPDQQTSNTSSKHPGADAALFSAAERQNSAAAACWAKSVENAK